MNIPEGYKLVPVKANCDQLHAGASKSGVLVIYEAMVEAAPAVEFNAYDEAKERELFIAEFKLEGKICYDENTKQWLPTSDTIKGFQMAERTLGCWIGWSACAKSRARSAE